MSSATRPGRREARGASQATPASGQPAATADAVPDQGGPEKPVLMEDWELRGAREQLATSLAAIMVALPIWAFHWRRFRRLAAEANAYLLYRIYAYAAMVVTLVTMIMAGGDLLRQPLLAALGGLDLSTLYARLSLTRGVVGSAREPGRGRLRCGGTIGGWWRPRPRGRPPWTLLSRRPRPRSWFPWHWPLGALVARYGEPLKRLDLERLYLHVLAAVFCFWTVSSVSGLVTFAAMMWTRTGAMEPLRLSERLATHIAYVLVGLPAWLLLYARARRLSRERRAGTMQRAYLYLMALFGALMAVIAGGMLLGQGVRLVMGLVDLSSPLGVRELQASAVRVDDQRGHVRRVVVGALARCQTLDGLAGE